MSGPAPSSKRPALCAPPLHLSAAPAIKRKKVAPATAAMASSSSTATAATSPPEPVSDLVAECLLLRLDVLLSDVFDDVIDFPSVCVYQQRMRRLLLTDAQAQLAQAYEANRTNAAYSIQQMAFAGFRWLGDSLGQWTADLSSGRSLPPLLALAAGDLVALTATADKTQPLSAANHMVCAIDRVDCASGRLTVRGRLDQPAGQTLGRHAFHALFAAGSPTPPLALTQLMAPVTAIREWAALDRVPSFSLAGPLLRPSESAAFCAPSPSSLRDAWLRLPASFAQRLERELNDSQLLAVQAAVLGAHRERPAFTLMQGPPGTGKTRTVVSILNSLHLRSFQLYYSSFVDRALDALQDGPSQSPAPAPAAKPRLLVCAPSNAGVDEIISRVMSGFVDGQLINYTPDIVRVGQSETMREDVKNRISLDALVDNYLRLSVAQLKDKWLAATNAVRRLQTEVGHMRLIFQRRYRELLDRSVQLFRVHSSAQADQQSLQASDLPAPRDAVDNQFVQSIAHTVEKKHLAAIEADRCRMVLECYGIPEQALREDAVDDRLQPLNKRQKTRAMDLLRLSILNQAQIVFCTLSGCGLELLSQLEQPFQAALIDEAGQATEFSTLIALQHNISHCILIGDPKQLPATVFAQAPASRRLIERSLLERLQLSGHFVAALLVQYRMHPNIRQFPSAHFYADQLRDSHRLHEERQAPFHEHSSKLFAPFLLFDCPAGDFQRPSERLRSAVAQRSRANKRSLDNLTEALVMVNFVHFFVAQFPQVPHSSIALITFYQHQKATLETLLAACSLACEVSTVDGFQGREADIVMISCVRSLAQQRSIGFVADVRRLNVALTRARLACWIFGDAAALARGSTQWAALVEHAQQQRLIRRASQFKQLAQFNQWENDLGQTTREERQ